MGLDMYLYRRRYVKNWDFKGPEHKTEVTLTIGNKPVSLVNVAYIWEEVGYWRKANQIHAFFVNLDKGRDECQQIYVSREQLIDLKERCEKVTADHKLGGGLLPSMGGFFFGNTDYDAWYYEDLKNTVAVLQPLLTEDDDSADYIYQASW